VIYFAIPDMCECCDCHEPLAQTWTGARAIIRSAAIAHATEGAAQFEDWVA
jgi:hypothetical protein